MLGNEKEEYSERQRGVKTLNQKNRELSKKY